MDWTKAKTILIIALIAANVFLLSMLGWQAFQENRAMKVTEQQTLTLLASRNVILQGNLPEPAGRLPVLEVRHEHLDEDLVAEKLAGQDLLTDNELAQESGLLKRVEAFGASCGFDSENMVLDKVDGIADGFVITYKNVVDDIPIEKSYLQFTVQDHRVSAVDCYWLEALHYGDTRHATISPVQALLEFVSYHGDEDQVVIKGIELVYWLDDSSIDQNTAVQDTAFPAWKITYNDGETEYIFAYDEFAA